MAVEESIKVLPRLFTIEDFERIVEAGIFGEDERVELIEGRVVQIDSISDAHIWNVTRSTMLFARGADILPSVQNPVRLSERTLPIADLAVLRPDAIQNRKPQPPDILRIVEVADSSLSYDRQIKAPLYGRAGIPELWIVDINGERIEVYREPSRIGYRSWRLFLRGDQIAPAFKPDLLIDVDEILGPATDAFD